MGEVKSGVYGLKNNDNGKVYIGISTDVNKQYQKLRNQLNADMYKKKNKSLQLDYNNCQGYDFEYEILERVPKEKLKQAEKKWLKRFDEDELYNPIVKEEKVKTELWLPDAKEFNVNEVASQLDYDIKFGAGRSEHVHNILDSQSHELESYISSPGHINQLVVSTSQFLSEDRPFFQKLQSISDFIIKPNYKDESHKNTPDNLSYDKKLPIESNHKQQLNNDRKVYIEAYTDLDSMIANVEDAKITRMSRRSQQAQRKVTEEDLIQYPYISEIYKSILNLDKLLEDKTRSDYYRLQRVRNQLVYELWYMKEHLRKPFGCMKVLKGSSRPDWDLIELHNPKHIYHLLSEAALVKNAEIRPTLDYLNKVIQQAKKSKRIDQIEYDILMMATQKDLHLDDCGVIYTRDKDGRLKYKKDKHGNPIMNKKGKKDYIPAISIDEWYMAEYINDTYQLEMNKRSIQHALKITIPNKLVETYQDILDEWNDNYVEIMPKKQCGSCQEYKYETDRYYGIDKRNNSGLKSICRTCEREQALEKNNKITG